MSREVNKFKAESDNYNYIYPNIKNIASLPVVLKHESFKIMEKVRVPISFSFHFPIPPNMILERDYT